MQKNFSENKILHRVAFVSANLNLGGTTTFMCNLGGALERLGHQAKVWSFTAQNLLAGDFASQKVQTATFDERKHIYEDRAQMLLGNLRRFQPTAVIANLGCESFEILRYVPHSVLRVGMVQSDHDIVFEGVSHYARHLDIIVGVSQQITEHLSRMPEFRSVSVRYQPYGVPMPAIPLHPASRDSSPLRILYLGRLEQSQKRVRLFPTILRDLKKSEIPFVWTLAGDGAELGYLKQHMVTERPDQTVIFLGNVAYKDVPNLLATQNVSLLASGFEGLPLSLLESMGHGVVPVISDLPSGVREVVNDSNGFLVSPDNIPGYADAIIKLHHNRDMLREKSIRAAESVRLNFSVEAMANRWLSMLCNSPVQKAEWIENAPTLPILTDPKPFKYSLPCRFFRRMLKRLRNSP